LALLAVALSPGAQARASDAERVTVGQWHEVESSVLGETRRVLISTPEHDLGPGVRFATIFLLDGEVHFRHTAGLVDFLTAPGVDLMPPAIVVAIANTDRTRDLTPRPSHPDPMFPTAGGADDFVAFLRDELIPFVDERFDTSGHRVLIGHSFGGLFAIHTLVHHPDVFDSYIAISPSLQWDDQALVAEAERVFSRTPERHGSLYMTVGNEGGALLGGVLKLAGVLEEHTPIGFEWAHRVMADETHTTVPHRSTRQGLEFVFRRWGLKDPMSLYDAGGIGAVLRHFELVGDRYGAPRAVPTVTFVQIAGGLGFSRGRLDEAADALSHPAAAASPGGAPLVASAFEWLAGAYTERGRRDRAIECYRSALSLNPASQTARAALEALGVDADTVLPDPPPPDRLRALAGVYTDDGGEMIEVRFDAGALTIRRSGAPAAPLIPNALGRFVTADSSAEHVFGVDAAGVRTLAIHQIGTAQRVYARRP